MSADPRVVRALLACYPANWRRRYGDEYAQLLCDLNVGRRPVLMVDSLRGAVRAHGGVLMSNRSPMAVAVWATGLFTVAGIGFQKLSEDVTGAAVATKAVVVVAAALALLALVAAATPTAVALVSGRDKGAWRYVAVPVLAAALWYGVLRVVLALAGDHGVHSAPTIVGFLVVAVAGIAVVVATAWAATTVLTRTPTATPAGLTRAALAVAALGMGSATVATLIWGLQVQAADPAGLGLLATPLRPSWVAAVAVMAVATGLTASAGWRQWRTGPGRQPATGAG